MDRHSDHIVGTVPRAGDRERVDGQAPAIIVLDARNVTLRGIQITGNAIGLGVLAAENLTVTGVWFHDNAQDGLQIHDQPTPSTATFTDVLVEGARHVGISVIGSTVSFERLVVRDMRAWPTDQGTDGVGLVLQPGNNATRISVVTIHHSIFERLTLIGVSNRGGQLTVTRSLF